MARAAYPLAELRELQFQWGSIDRVKQDFLEWIWKDLKTSPRVPFSPQMMEVALRHKARNQTTGQ
jgi:hypothetical protein